ISPLLALVALVTIPLTLGITVLIAKRSQKLFVAQWKNTGELNAQIEEGYTGHALVKVFGRHKEVEARFAEKNEELFRASFGAQFISGLIMPANMFVGNLVYVGIAVVGGLLFSQLLTLYITPVIYIYLDKIDSYISGRSREERETRATVDGQFPVPQPVRQPAE
ncbi:MAG: hypothetical protein KDJ29_00810, partial [Hyphomicrobiales bacterium]|nr:hypothetical protein [Hyphomicrobiales bacterium]